MATKDKNSIADIIEEVVRDKIHSAEIVKVTAERQRTDDGDDIIVVNVIFDSKRKLDARETSQITRHVWKRLMEKEVSGFPSFSFIAKSEAGKLAAA